MGCLKCLLPVYTLVMDLKDKIIQCICITKNSPEKQNLSQNRYLLWGISACNNGSSVVLQSMRCKLETLESWWYNSVWVERPEKEGSWWHPLLSEVKRRWDEISQLSRDRKKEWIPFFLPFVLFRPSTD